MKEIQLSPAAASVVRLCMDAYVDNDWRGRIYTRYSEEPLRFRNLNDVLRYLDQFYDWLGYPQASTVDRSFSGRAAKTPVRNQIQQRRYRVAVKDEGKNKEYGLQSTFVVSIQYRQNATWQGRVTWAEKNRTLPFRSALELLKLIDSAEESGGDAFWNS